MAASFRIIARGRLSERPVGGFAGGVLRRVEGDRTVVAGVPGGRPAAGALVAVGDQGVEVVDVADLADAAGPAPSSSSQEDS